jgi:hypothetical protein
MRCRLGQLLPLEYIPILLEIKSLPHYIREQIAKDIAPKSDDSIISLGETNIAEGPCISDTANDIEEDFADVKRWVDSLEDEFEPIIDQFGEEYEDFKFSRSINTKRPSHEKHEDQSDSNRFDQSTFLFR